MDRNPVLLYKTLVVGVILLLLCMSVSPSVAIDNVKKSTYPIGSGNTLYVGGSGEGNYTSIQDAIDDASDGDTVFVYNDSSPYYENIIVDKSINLVGEDKNSTIINGGSARDVVYVSADYVNITGFKIRMSGEDSYGIHIFSNYNNINNNNLYDYQGIRVKDSIGNNISSNNFFVEEYCIVLNGSEYNNIYNNYICNGSYSRRIVLFSSSCNNIVSKNTIIDGTAGIHLFSTSNNNIVSKNTIIDCFCGITINGDNNDINNNYLSHMHDGVFIDGNYNSIYKNYIDCSDGIVIDDYRFSQGFSKNNDIYENYIDGGYRGVALTRAINNKIHRNNIIDCTYGLYYEGINFLNRIYENNFIDNECDCRLEFFLPFIPLIILRNRFDRNYWGRPLLFPKIIVGSIYTLTFWYPFYMKVCSTFRIDWHPAKEPYDIEV